MLSPPPSASTTRAHFHPQRYLDGLARAFTAAGGRLFEHSRAVDVDEHTDHVEIRTPGAAVRAEQAVLATLLPITDRGGFFAKARPTRAYGIAARLRGTPPTGMHINIGSPTRSTRPCADGAGVIVVGETHPTGHDDAGPARWGALER